MRSKTSSARESTLLIQPTHSRGPRKAHRLLAVGVLFAGISVLGVGCESESPPTTVRTGGSTQTGGSSSTGGKAATGGSIATGGMLGTGGVTQTGGVITTGGTATGGVRTGGDTATGGIVRTGGTSPTGGSLGTGGVSVTGGTSSSGGVPMTGGIAGSGGVLTDGGARTGGVQGTGGVRPDSGVPDLAPSTDTNSSTGFSACPAGAACKILPLGDSITEGCCTAPMGGYRIELFNQAVTNKKALTFVGAAKNGPTTVAGTTFPQQHAGYGGYWIEPATGHNGIGGTITNNALTNYKPNIVLLMIGTNDINGGSDAASAGTRLGKLMDDIITGAPNALLVVASIIPSRTDGTNTRFQAYNALIPPLVDARAKAGKHVVFLDNYKAVSADANYKTALLADNLHPNTAGYVVLGKSFYGVIGPLLPNAQ